MFNDLFRRLEIDPINDGVSTVDAPATGERPVIYPTNPATGQPLPARPDGRHRGVRSARRAGLQDLPELADGPAARAGRGGPPDRLGAPRTQGRPRPVGNPRDGKIRSEGEGEVQEMIDMCDFAVGLSRQLYGLTIASERPRHRMLEQWHPLGPLGIITAFNFPVAVWAWNAMIAAVCGDTMIWKPSPRTPLTAVAVQGHR